MQAGQIEQAAQWLRRGSLVIVPTDTVYGVAAHPDMPGAVERLCAAKGRDRAKPIPLLAAARREVERYGAIFGPAEKALAERFWPGPLTLVLRVPGGGTEGFRVPQHATMLALLEACGGLLRVSSANRSGEPPALTADAARRALGADAAFVVDAGPVPGGVASTVVRLTAQRGVEVLREGAIPRGDIVQTVEKQERIMRQRLIVFVCTGNVCRSPMAEYMFREAAGRAMGWEVVSAGVAAAYGVPASREAVEVLAEQGVDLRMHSSRPLTHELAKQADLLVVMTNMHRDLIQALFPDVLDKVVLLRSFDPASDSEDIEDPIGSSHDMYRKVRDEIAAALPGLAAHVRGQAG